MICNLEARLRQVDFLITITSSPPAAVVGKGASVIRCCCNAKSTLASCVYYIDHNTRQHWTNDWLFRDPWENTT
jgi:hypothetical protein